MLITHVVWSQPRLQLNILDLLQLALSCVHIVKESTQHLLDVVGTVYVGAIFLVVHLAIVHHQHKIGKEHLLRLVVVVLTDAFVDG